MSWKISALLDLSDTELRDFFLRRRWEKYFEDTDYDDGEGVDWSEYTQDALIEMLKKDVYQNQLPAGWTIQYFWEDSFQYRFEVTQGVVNEEITNKVEKLVVRLIRRAFATEVGLKIFHSYDPTLTSIDGSETDRVMEVTSPKLKPALISAEHIKELRDLGWTTGLVRGQWMYS